jgi:hypothetical protein
MSLSFRLYVLIEALFSLANSRTSSRALKTFKYDAVMALHFPSQNKSCYGQNTVNVRKLSLLSYHMGNLCPYF